MGPSINIPILLAAASAGFGLILLNDILQIRQKSDPPLFVPLSGILLIGASSASLCLLAPLPEAPLWPGVFGLLLTAASGFMVIQTTFLEFPKQDSDSEDNRRLYDSGSYGLTRHPGFLWYLLCLSAIVLTYRDLLVAICALLLMTMELAVVIIEDFWLFPRIFPGYADYKKRVPMLFPFPMRNQHTDS